MDFGFGFLPDLLRGKSFKDALETNAKQGAMAGLAMFGLPAAGAGEAVGATTGAFDFSPSFGGLLEGAKEAASYAKPIGEAAGAANAVGGLLTPQPVQGHAPQGINPAGAQTLAQLYQQGQVSPEEQARLQRKTMWG